METKGSQSQKEILLFSDPMRDYSSDDIVGLEIWGIQSLKFGDQMNDEQGIKNELRKENGD